MKKYRTIKKLLTFGILTFVGLAGFWACRKQDDTYRKFLENGITIYAGKADSITVHPGKNRVKLSWIIQADPDVDRAIVYWNNQRDSVSVTIQDPTESREMDVVIPDMIEGAYTFEIYTFDTFDNTSVRAEVTGRVYGDSYNASLVSRPIASATTEDDNVIIDWHPADEEAYAVEILYPHQDGTVHSVEVSSEETSTILENYKMGQPFRFRTLYLPHPLALDTFYTDYEEVEVEELPIVEQLIPKPFTALNLATDAGHYNTNVLSRLWSGVQNLSSSYRSNDAGIPHHYSFDLGVKTRLTRYVVHHRGAANRPDILYNSGNLKRWEVWGSEGDYDPDGSYEGWTKLIECTALKPSGLPRGEFSPEDLAYFEAGEEFAFPSDLPAVRYIRIKVLEVYDESKQYSETTEMTFYGGIQ